jgi:hypothetical protein
LFLIAFHSKLYDFSIPDNGKYLLKLYYSYNKILIIDFYFLVNDFGKSSSQNNTSGISKVFQKLQIKNGMENIYYIYSNSFA